MSQYRRKTGRKHLGSEPNIVKRGTTQIKKGEKGGDAQCPNEGDSDCWATGRGGSAGDAPAYPKPAWGWKRGI